MKIMLCGDINSGKSTLIRKLLEDMGKPPKGYITVRMPAVDGVSKVYLYDIANPPERVEDAAVIITIENEVREKHPELLDTLGVQYLTDIPAGSVVVLDEIGSLESASPEFQKAVMRILSGDYTVLAAVKAANTDFLRAVRKHPDCELYIITPDNRDALYKQIKAEYNI
ncbi:MAG: nucleoside-triphosphatase [Oscillospiraceae bacterium]|nr:nucleoside-triphosphatase [Oscillospiraceae bacterium]